MADLIDRQAAIEAHCELCGDGDKCNCDICPDVEVFQLLPSAQPEPKTGRWIPQDWNEKNGTSTTLVYCLPKCSVCGYSAIQTNYCPNCGARMMGFVNGEKGDGMSDLIDRQAAIDAVNAYLQMSEVSKTVQNMTSIQAILRQLPTAEPKTGRWISDKLVSTNGGAYGVRRCSECEACYPDSGHGWNFCPNCGAYMREEA